MRWSMTTTIRPCRSSPDGFPGRPASLRNLRSREISSVSRLCPLPRLNSSLFVPTSKRNSSFPCGSTLPICPIRSTTELQLRSRGSLPPIRRSSSSLWSCRRCALMHSVSHRRGKRLVRFSTWIVDRDRNGRCSPPPFLATNSFGLTSIADICRRESRNRRALFRPHRASRGDTALLPPAAA